MSSHPWMSTTAAWLNLTHRGAEYQFGDKMSSSWTDVQLDKASLRHEAAIERRQLQWLKSHGLR